MSAVQMIIEGRKKDLGGFTVARVLPYAKHRMVGPFIFVDEMGPARFPPGKGIDVRPHPHIGLATVTYLFEGEMDHADSLGVHQTIRPGDVNWMTAGRGIVHSERTGPSARESGFSIHGLQTWVALPEQDEETEPAFHHHPAETLPRFDEGGADLRLILGEAYGRASPVKSFSPIVYIHAELAAGAELALPGEHEELGVYVVSGGAHIRDVALAPGQLAVVDPTAGARLTADAASRIMILGGSSLGPRFIDWNFVSSSQDRIEQAKTDWRASAADGWSETAFQLPPGEHEHIPLPGDPDPGGG